MELAGLIWTTVAQPRHRVIMWLPVLGRLLTKERMIKLNLKVEDPCCCLCDTQSLETSSHLFAECSWVANVRREVMQWTNTHIQAGD